MTNLETIPQMDGYETKLAQEWVGGTGTMFLQNAPSFTMPVGETCYVVVQPKGSNLKIAEFDSINAGNNTINITNVTLEVGAGLSNPTGITYPSNTDVLISDNYQFWKDIQTAIASKLDNDGGNTTTTFDLSVQGSSFRLRLDGGDMKFTDDNNVEISLSTIAAAAGADRKVAITTNDTTPGQLDEKIDAGDGLTKTVVNPGADETLKYDIDIITTNGLNINGGQLDVKNGDETDFGTAKKATDAEVLAGIEDTKFVTSKGIKDNNGLYYYEATASDNIKNSSLGLNSVSMPGDNYYEVKTLKIGNTNGSFRFTGEVRLSINYTDIAFGYKVNGGTFQSVIASNIGDTFISYSVDITAEAGDDISIGFDSSVGIPGSGTPNGEIQNNYTKYDLENKGFIGAIYN